MKDKNDTPILSRLFGSLQSEMSAQMCSSSNMSHPTDMGDNTEKSWIEWFNHYLPKRYKAAKATIIDSQGGVSDQIDVVLFDGQYSYLAFNRNGILYIPAESVYAVFEIKQTLNKRHMEYAGLKAESVRKLQRTSAPIPTASGMVNPKPLHRIVAGILTTSSEWKEPFAVPFKRCLTNYSELQQVDCGCVLNEGAYYYDYEERILKTSSEEESLVSFFLQLLILLQEIGTVPAINLNEYMKALSLKEGKI